MSEPTSVTLSETADEIGRAMSSIWQRRYGIRPRAIETEYVGGVVRCTIDDGERSGGAADGSFDSAGEQRDAQRTVARLTRRQVQGHVATRDKKSGRATEVFILEPVRTKN
jgi:hypothetical protein